MSDREEYFRKFPLINYNGQNGINIMRRIDFDPKVKALYQNFYEHTLTNNEDIQTLAHDYYDEVDLDWLIYLTNNIVDPYYDVPLKENDFSTYIKKKYGSIEKAQQKIIVYKTNYESDPGNILNIAGYNALTGAQKKYWQPIKTPNGILGYERAKDDIFITTNKILLLEFATEQSNTFIKDENVYIENNLEQKATVSSANTTAVILRNIDGDFDRDSNFNIVGKDSNLTIEIKFDTYNLLKQVIPVSEEAYFTKLTAYDYEETLNENKRDIKLVEEPQAESLNRQLTDILK